MSLYFKDDKYRIVSKDIQNKSANGYYETCTLHSPEDAFLVLIKDFPIENLDNLCNRIQMHIPKISLEESYSLSQGDFSQINSSPNNVKKIILDSAIECIESGIFLGNHMRSNGQGNSSSFFNHSLFASVFASNIAIILGVDSKKAATYSLLHDYGRRFTHSFNHVVRGFEALVDIGWTDEAIATLTHSFLNNYRCANCELPEKGFYVDSCGNPCWKDDIPKDDLGIFLESYNYTIYDKILNLSDLTATSQGIVSPFERVIDIKSRRPINLSNEKHFLLEFHRTINEILPMMGVFGVNYSVDSTAPLEWLREEFRKCSIEFFSAYKQNIKNILLYKELNISPHI